MSSPSLLLKLRELVSCKISTDKEFLELYGTDWTREFIPNPLAVTFPKTVEDVRKITTFANANKIPLTPSGGRTGLSAGAVASEGELVVSFEKMNKILSFNEIDRTLEVEAGVTTQQVQEFASTKELYYPVDFSSRGSSQIGGNIATNAGGIHVIRYGSTRNWVTGLKVVTGRGELLDLNMGLTKNATGYDLKNLFIGSEGTLGFIVEATLQLTSKPRQSSVMLTGTDEIGKSVEILNMFREKITLNAFEFFSANAVEHITSKTGKNFPIKNSYMYYLLMDFETPTDIELEKVDKIYRQAARKKLIGETVISRSTAQNSKLWELRENVTESISKFLTYKNDISVRTSQIPAFIKEIEETLQRKYPDFSTILFGHIGDGNIHVSILKPESLNKQKFLETCKNVNKSLFGVVSKYKGSISAEHGVGLIKKPYLTYTRTNEEINIMRGIKKVFDPNNILNPGKIFPDQV